MHILRLLAIAGFVACASETKERAPTYRDDVAAVLNARCSSCHADGTGGFRVGTYADAVGCLNGSTPKAMLNALAKPSHSSVADTRDLIARWVAAGAPPFARGVHEPSFADPRSPDSHGRFLRAQRWRPMLDAKDDNACGRCHEGAPARTANTPAAGATPCTSCHAEGPLGCTTCHGAGGKIYPPRDGCFFADKKDAHAAHVEKSSSTTIGIACARCHPVPTVGAPSGNHGDGYVTVTIDGTFDNGACATKCHGSARPKWVGGEPFKCGGCHSIPPPMHPAGQCNWCHREANADGTALINPVLHMNGRADRGDGSGKCGACHGTGDDPWPSSGAHQKHKAPMNAVPIACETCHPAIGADHPHGGPAIVTLTGLAGEGSRMPTFDATAKTCANVYCHDGPGGSMRTPMWTAKLGCGSCHASPPPAPHTTATTCGTTCHVQPRATTHVNGKIEL